MFSLLAQLRIRVECCFGMLVHRWLILRSAFPQRFTIRKVIAIVNVLAKLHNFCINQKDEDFSPDDHDQDSDNSTSSSSTPEAGAPDDGDEENQPNRGLQLQTDPDFDIQRPVGLMDGGRHFDDYPRSLRRRYTGVAQGVPRERMRRQVELSHRVRPTARDEEDS